MPESLQFPSSMGQEDALLWALERDPGLRSTAAAVTLLDRAPQRRRLVAALEAAACAVPRLRQRVVELPAMISPPVWAEDPHFDLSYHLRFVRAPGDGSLEELLPLAAALVMQGFDRSRPLWEFLVVEDLEGGRAALIQKLHHAVTDGVAGVMLMQRVYETSADPVPSSRVPREPIRATPRGILRLSAEALWRRLSEAPDLARQRASGAMEIARHPLESMRETSEALGSLAPMFSPALRPTSPLMQDRSTRYRFETLRMPLADLKAAAHAAGCKLNDAYLAGLTGGWQRYHARHATSIDLLRAMIPLDLRGSQSGSIMGNSLSLARFSLPTQDADPSRRMQRIREIIGSQGRRPPAAYIEAVAGLLNLLPPALLTTIFGTMARSVDFIASCVPGPPDLLYLAGSTVEAILPFGPTGGAAANFTLFSYAGEAAVTINADPAAVPDAHVLRDCMHESFQEVMGLARPPAAHSVRSG